MATQDGLLRGKHAEGVDQFLGIPYAAPPVGPLRWQAPRPARPWAGVRDATAYGNRGPQLASQDGPRQDNEDCLFLNVFSPVTYPPRYRPRRPRRRAASAVLDPRRHAAARRR